MFKQVQWPIWFIIFSLMLSLAFVVGKLTLAIQDVIDEPAIFAETREDISNTSFLKIEEIDKRIQNKVLEEERIFLEKLKNMDYIIDSNFILEIDDFNLNDHLYSIIMTAKPMAYENNNTEIHAFTINLENKEIIALNGLIKEEKIKSDAFYSLIKESIGTEHKKAQLDKVEVKNQLELFDQINWTINQEYITFYLNSDHSIEVKIPIVQLHSFLKEDIKQIIMTEEIMQQLQFQPRKLDKEGKYIALTFDDGPNQHVTPRILKTLKKYDAKATFYMVSENVNYYPKIAKQVVEAGHEVANHTVSHPNLNQVKSKQMKKELIQAFKVIEETTGQTPNTFRPPYGEFNESVVDYATEINQTVVLWSVDTLDWKNRNKNSVFKRAKSAKPGSIILMHDLYPTTADALPKILKYFSDKDYEFVTVSELLPLIEGEEFGPYYGN